MTTDQNTDQGTHNEESQRDFLVDVSTVLTEAATIEQLAEMLTRHDGIYNALTTTELDDYLAEHGIPQTPQLGVWVIDPALVREALARREATSIPAKVHPEHASNGQSMSSLTRTPSSTGRSCSLHQAP